MTSAPNVRTVRISKIVKRPASPRIDRAMIENERSVPVIQKMTRRRREVVTDYPVAEFEEA